MSRRNQTAEGRQMYAVNVEEFGRWSSMKNRAYRFWVRAWIDSLHVGTHIHWQLSPLSVLGLAFMWQFFANQESHYTRGQRTSIKAMSRRRLKDPGFFPPMPSFDDDDCVWDSFFSRQISSMEQIREELIDWHLTKLESCIDMETLYSNMTSLFSSLLLAGFTNDQLFRKVCKGILDPSLDSPPEENLILLWS